LTDIDIRWVGNSDIQLKNGRLSTPNAITRKAFGNKFRRIKNSDAAKPKEHRIASVTRAVAQRGGGKQRLDGKAHPIPIGEPMSGTNASPRIPIGHNDWSSPPKVDFSMTTATPSSNSESQHEKDHPSFRRARAQPLLITRNNELDIALFAEALLAR
jgi:hypothetical protein